MLIGTDMEMFAWLEDFVDAVCDPGFLSRKSRVLRGISHHLSVLVPTFTRGGHQKDVCQLKIPGKS